MLRATIFLIVLLSYTAGCSHVVRGQKIPDHRLDARAEDFVVGDDVAVLHYYGSGGWGIQWRGSYILTAPYFSNHGLARLQVLSTLPDAEQLQDGFSGTPVGNTQLLLVGHGHIDHAGDIPGFFAPQLITGKPGLIASRTTTNILAPMLERFGCVAPIEYTDHGKPIQTCGAPNVRVTPIHSAHAAHVAMFGLKVQMYGGTVPTPRKELPKVATDFLEGYTWAYLIDLLDEAGEVAFRIHYMDAAASPPHGIAPDEILAQRDVDVHIACTPGFDLVSEYPKVVLEHHKVRYVLAAHWEDFFQSRDATLSPVRMVLNEDKLNDFVDRIEAVLGAQSQGVQPQTTTVPPQDRGPRGNNWAMPVPGETFQFRVTTPDSEGLAPAGS